MATRYEIVISSGNNDELRSRVQRRRRTICDSHPFPFHILFPPHSHPRLFICTPLCPSICSFGSPFLYPRRPTGSAINPASSLGLLLDPLLLLSVCLPIHHRSRRPKKTTTSRLNLPACETLQIPIPPPSRLTLPARVTLTASRNLIIFD